MNRHKKSLGSWAGQKPLAVMCMVMMMLAPKPGFAACDTGPGTSSALTSWVQDSIALIQSFEQELIDFFTADIDTGEVEIQTRIQEFDENVRVGLTEWWTEEMRPAMQDQTKQLHTATLHQTQMTMSQMDAQDQNRQLQALNEIQTEAHKRHTPSDFACQADSVNPGYGRREKAAREIARGAANDAARRAVAAEGTPEAIGPVAVAADKWDRYTANYCDVEAFNGVSGCDVNGPMPNADITMGSAFLWGDQMSFNLDTPYNVQLYEDLQRNFVDQSSPSAIPPDRIETLSGIRQFNLIRSNAARKQSIHAVVGQIMADRVAGPAMEPLPEVREMRIAAGIPPENTTETPSKHEILHTLAEERYMTPDFAMQITNNPHALLRGNLDSKTLHLQQVTQMHKRMEELAVMMASEFAEDIEHREAHSGGQLRYSVDVRYRQPESSYTPIDPDTIPEHEWPDTLPPWVPGPGPGELPPPGAPPGTPSVPPGEPPVGSGVPSNECELGVSGEGQDLAPASSYSLSAQGLADLKHHEGLELEVYLDVAGKPTIGHGHLLRPGESFPNGITEAEAEALLQQDLVRFENAVRSMVNVPITQGMYDAMVSFAFNFGEGEGGYGGSTLLRRLNAGDYEGAQYEFSRWINATVDGVKQPVQGLINRRYAEMVRFGECT